MATKEERIKEKRQAAIMKSKGTTGEPLVSEAKYSIDLPLALNWYNVHSEYKQKREWVYQYLLVNNLSDLEPKLKKLDDWQFAQFGSMCRISNIGGYISPKHRKWMSDKLEYYSNYVVEKSQIADNVAVPKHQAPVREKYLDECVEIDNEIDTLIKTKNSNFNMKSFIAKRGLNSAIVKKISDYYKKTHIELQEALLGTDEQLIEGYSCYTRNELKKLCSMITDIVNTSAQLKVQRAPRAKKEKPVSVIVKDVVLVKEFAELGLKSEEAKTIVGAKELWMFNTKSKRLFHYISLDANGFAVKGKYIKNFDVIKSTSKTIRKPSEYFKDLNMPKKAMTEKYDSVKSVAAKSNGKIYEDNVLLKVY